MNRPDSTGATVINCDLIAHKAEMTSHGQTSVSCSKNTEFEIFCIFVENFSDVFLSSYIRFHVLFFSHMPSPYY